MLDLPHNSLSDWTDEIVLEDNQTLPLHVLLPQDWCLLVLFRHAECMECNLLVHQLNTIQNHLTQWGVKVIGIGNGKVDSIRRLRIRLSISDQITLGTHPQRLLHKKLGLLVSLLGAFGPKALWHTFKGLYDGHLQTSIARPMTQQSGLILLNPKKEICWIHQSQYLGDIPSHGQILEQILINQGGTL
jgi:hypothetical protein